MDFKIDSPISDTEKKVMKRMIEKIDIQITELELISQKKVNYHEVKSFIEVLKSNMEYLES